MKRMLCLLLALSMLLSGCGGGGEAAKETAAAALEATAAETTEAPTTEPTLSPEEVLYNSLPDKVRQAVDLGIVELAALDDLARICTGAEAAQMLQNARVSKRGSESVVLSQVKDSVHADIEVTRYWMAQMMHAAEMELFAEPVSGDYLENVQYLIWDGIPKMMENAGAYFHQPQWIVSENYGVVSHTTMKQAKFNRGYDQESVIAHQYVTGVADFLEGSWEMKDKPEEWVKYVDYGSPESMSFALLFYDKTTGEKLLPWNDDMEFCPREKMNMEEAVEAALRYYNYFPKEAEMLAYADVPAYDSNIITEELLKKETTLPEASCQSLPREWKGVVMQDLLYDNAEYDAKTDVRIYENEIQLVKDAGFNYVRILFDFEYYMSEIADQYYIFSKRPKEGMVNETHLKELDQIIAWCMERDIHVNLSCTSVAGWSTQAIPDSILSKSQNARPMAEQWQVLARRYAGIPNTYLSFTLYENPPIWQDAGNGKFFSSVVEAIREVSPDRCIIADLSQKSTGESMAQLGVALSTRAVLPDEFKFDPRTSEAETSRLFAAAQWPYQSGGTYYDGAAAMTRVENWIQSAPDDVAAVAEQYGVGFMVSSWAPYMDFGNAVRRDRFSDEWMKAFLTDMTQTMETRGYGWCYENWFGFMGFAAAYPAITSTTYTKINNTPLYVDNEVFGWFQEINGVQ